MSRPTLRRALARCFGRTPWEVAVDFLGCAIVVGVPLAIYCSV